MSKKDVIEGAANAVSKHLPKTTEAIDTVVSTVIGVFDILLAPFQFLKETKDSKLQIFKNNLRKKMEIIPPESVEETIKLNVVGPTLEALKYTFMEDELRSMFESLIASSIDKREAVFPSFVDIVRQLSPDEAKLLKYISAHGYDYPLVDLRYILPNGQGFIEVITNFTNIGDALLEKPEMISAYIKDLERFGLLEIQHDTYLASASLYEDLKNHPIIQDGMASAHSDKGHYDVQKHKFIVTDYGKAFISSCVVGPKM